MNKIDAFKYFGNATRTAAGLRISDAAVSKWDSTVPLLRAVEIQSITRGALIVDLADYSALVDDIIFLHRRAPETR